MPANDILYIIFHILHAAYANFFYKDLLTLS